MAHLKSLMPGLTAKVFRTYNASITLQQELDKIEAGPCTRKDYILFYNQASQRTINPGASSTDNLKLEISVTKLNYLDPRITVAWCKRTGVDVNKIFSKSLTQKVSLLFFLLFSAVIDYSPFLQFPWALNVEPDFRF